MIQNLQIMYVYPSNYSAMQYGNYVLSEFIFMAVNLIIVLRHDLIT